MMPPPNPILVYRAGINNMLDYAILWHLALCGLTGATLPDVVAATQAYDNTVRGSLARLETLKMIVATRNRDLPGHPLTWVCSRLGYRLMTGHLKAEQKDTGAGQMPLGSEITHTL